MSFIIQTENYKLKRGMRFVFFRGRGLVGKEWRSVEMKLNL